MISGTQMNELWLTVYGNQSSPLENPAFLLDQFEQQHHVAVRVSRMQFEEAWPKLLDFALYGGGPHISVIGSVWTSTLRSMNVLRPFTPAEVASLGGAGAFFPAAWETPKPGETEHWAIPVELFTYLVLYRRDRLAQAGIAEAGAFSSPRAMLETVRRLKAFGGPSPLVLPSGKPYSARPHLLASWIWGAGGNFLSADGHSVAFTGPEAIRGLVDFFSLYRLQSPADCGLDFAGSLDRFAAGDAAVTIWGVTAQQELERCHNPQVLENIGVAPMPGVPWIGGSSLVIWKEARLSLERERAALELTRFLTRPAAQVKMAAAQYLVPATVEALAQHTFAVPAFRAAVERSVLTGRAYPRANLWVRILRDLRGVCDAITSEVIERPADDIEDIVRRHLKPLVTRLNLVLA
jgi:multiple sugar transport system substrate-binding protein